MSLRGTCIKKQKNKRFITPFILGKDSYEILVFLGFLFFIVIIIYSLCVFFFFFLLIFYELYMFVLCIFYFNKKNKRFITPFIFLKVNYESFRVFIFRVFCFLWLLLYIHFVYFSFSFC
jgi:hypothetical protein